MASIYTSNPLKFGDSTDIRVLKILSDKTYCASAPISCRVQIIELKDESRAQTPYNALSYVWGNADKTRAIHVNGKPFEVRENLWQFLDQMRKVRYKKRIWIDAICINQQSNGEKSHQVAMMGEIYSKAARVEIWLGPTKNGTVRAMRALPYLHWSRTCSFLVRKLRLRSLRAHLPFNVRQGIMSQNWEAFADDLQVFFHEEYWTRAWIVQEYMLAKKHTFWCGSQKMDSNILKCIVDRKPGFSRDAIRIGMKRDSDNKWLKERWAHPYHWILYRNLFTPARHILDAEPTKHKDGILGGYPKLFQDLHCSDSRDRIYAALPLLRVHYTEEQLTLTPDYLLSVAELFEAVYDRYPRARCVSSRRMTSHEMLIIRDMLYLDREDKAAKRVFAKIWGLPIGDVERLCAQDLAREAMNQMELDELEEDQVRSWAGIGFPWLGI